MNRVAWPLIALGLIAAGCSFLPSPNPLEAQPAPGVIHIVGKPAATDLEIRIVGDDGSLATFADTVSTGAPIEVQRWSLPARLGLAVNGVRCSGTIEVLSDRMTTVTISIGDGCDIESATQGAMPTP